MTFDSSANLSRVNPDHAASLKVNSLTTIKAGLLTGMTPSLIPNQQSQITGGQQ